MLQMNMKCFLSIILLIHIEIIVTTKVLDNKNTQKCFHSHCLPIDYQKLEAPIKASEPLKIETKIDLLQILEIDEVKFTVTLSINIVISWEDFRITGPTPNDPADQFPIDIRFIDSLWLPDIYIYDMKEILPIKFNIPFAGNNSLIFQI